MTGSGTGMVAPLVSGAAPAVGATAPVALRGDGLTLGYRQTAVVHDACVELRAGRVTALIGPNGSGKSTLLRSLARLHDPVGGRVQLGRAGGSPEDVAALSAREFARRVTMLSQSRPHPSGLTVREVVAFGRHPYRRRFAALDATDRAAIDRAMALSGTVAMGDRGVDQLSGGELQRVWLATCLAQGTDVLLLDEPTNHLDLRYQVQTLDLIRELADDHGAALGVVLHDLNQAAAVADEVVLMSEGRVVAVGPPADALSARQLSEVYGLQIDVGTDPGTGFVRVDPRGTHHRRGSAPTPPKGTP